MPGLILIFVIYCFLLMYAVELIVPRNSWPRVPFWILQTIFFNLIQIASVILATLTWDSWLQNFSILDCSNLPRSAAIAIGYLTITYIYYWWHRARHASPYLWRKLHQLHHSAERLELITSFYKHPFEIISNSFLSSFILYVLLGLDPPATTIVVIITGLSELFYHWNIKTPYWLGFLIQRPESHCIHHTHQHHHHNYSYLPIWDILFGTFYNPKETEFRCGFDRNKSKQILKMLNTTDVHQLEKNS